MTSSVIPILVATDSTDTAQPFSGFGDDVAAAATVYAEHGFIPIPCDPASGKTLIAGWGSGVVDVDDALSKFIPAGINVALLCGANGYVDIDLDDNNSARIAPEFLPETSFKFGRASRPTTHYGYRVDSPLENLSLKATSEFAQRPLVEILAKKHLVRVPPSTHPSGEKVRFEEGCAGHPAHTTAEKLTKAVALIGVTTFMSFVWPETAGQRHELALAFSGALLRSGLLPEDVQKVLYLAAREAGDEEYKERSACVKTTAKKLEQGASVTGWPSVKEILGEAGDSFVETVNKWLTPIAADLKQMDLANIVISAKALLESTILTPPAIVEPWLREGNVGLIYAPAKVGKSWTALELAINIATAQTFLDYEVPSAKRTLYIDGEMMRAEIKERTEKLAGGSDNLLFLTSDVFAQTFDRTLDLTQVSDQQAVEGLIDIREVRVVFIDTLASLAPRKDENDNASPELLRFTRWLSRMKAKGITFVLVHHAGHEGKHPRGASALMGFVDIVIALRKQSGDDLIEWEFTHTRGKCPEPYKRHIHINDGGDVVTIDIANGGQSKPELQLLPLLLSGGFSSQAALGHETGKSTGTINGWLKNLRKMGLVQAKGLALTTKGKNEATALS